MLLKPVDKLEVDIIGDYFEADGLQGYRGTTVNGTRPAVLLAPASANPPVDPDPYHISVTPGTGDTATHGGGVSGTIRYDGGSVGITSITAFRAGRLHVDGDLDATALDTYSNPARESSHQFSEELRFASQAGGPLTFANRVNWIFGLYYFTESVNRTDTAAFGSDNRLLFLNQGNTFANDLVAKPHTNSYAAFGQAGVQIVEGLKLDLGLRYSEDRKRAELAAISPTGIGATPFDIDIGRNFKSVDPSAALSYKFSDVLLFTSYSHGFKSGALQYGATTEALARTIVDPEKVNAYQAGIKSELLDRHLRLNISGFLYKYGDIQVPRFGVPEGAAPGTPPGPILTNAGRSTIKGFEIEGVGLITNRLHVDYSYAYLDARYDSYVFSPTIDFSGNRMPRAPKNTVNISPNYTLPTDFGDVVFRASGNYVSSLYFEADDAKIDPGTREPGRTLFDASVNFNLRAFNVEFWVHNLTGKAYRQTVLNISGSRLDETWAQRRTVGATLSAKW